MLQPDSDDENYAPLNIEQLHVGEPLPGAVFLQIAGKYLKIRNAGDPLPREIYDKLQIKNIVNVFVERADLPRFESWIREQAAEQAREDSERDVRAELHSEPDSPLPPVIQVTPHALKMFKKDAQRKLLDVFRSDHPDELVRKTVSTSRKLVSGIMKEPVTLEMLTPLMNFAKGTVNHSVNVSILAVYLAIRMRITDPKALQYIAQGALLMDIGKSRILINEVDSDEKIEEKMASHPSIGFQLLSSKGNQVSLETKLIVAQHHEHHDGSGYPQGLRGGAIHDFARIVSIAESFDTLVTGYEGTIQERQQSAVDQLDAVLFRHFDPIKHEIAIRVLSGGF